MTQLNIGLVLSGGMAKGAYQIGALRAISEFIAPEDISFVSCASVGVLNGYAFATGQLDSAEEMWKSLCEDDSRLFVSQLLRSSLLQQNISRLYDTAEKPPMSFYCSLFDFNHFDLVYKDLANVKDTHVLRYLKASVAMPVYNRAVKVGTSAYFDGAMIDNIPVYPLLKKKLDYIICIYFDDVSYTFENTYFDNKVIKITFPADGILKQSLWFKKENIDDMIRHGYSRASAILRSVFYDGKDDLNSIYKAIEQNNCRAKSHSLRITGDVLVTNLNKIAQKLTKRKIL